jgi:hypothetical protein
MATIFTPYTDFVATMAGLAVGAATLVLLRSWFTGAAPAAAPVAVAIVLATLVMPVLWRGAAGLDAARAGLKAADPNARHQKCFIDRGAQWQLGFLAWVGSRVPSDDSFAINSDEVDRACFQLNMLPRRLVRPDEDPMWTVKVGAFSRELRDRIRRERSLPDSERTVLVFDRKLALIRER